MVKIRIIVEGGGAGGNTDVATANNTEVLRQSLNSFFSKLLSREDIDITVDMGHGYRAAAKYFLQNSFQSVLFVDLDTPRSKKNDWFKKLETENKKKPMKFLEEHKQNIYFMIQEMEAWFLKQPECFEKWAEKENYIKRDASKISEHSLLKNKDVDNISKPSYVTATLLKHFFEKKLPNNKTKLARYGKLKTAPSLIDCLDVCQLEKHDKELRRFKRNTISSIGS